MSGKQQIDALADRIKREIESLGACSLEQQELAVLWGDDTNMPHVEYQMRIANFSLQYGFIHRMDAAYRRICFRKAGVL
ncbi:MAG TPA: hypothetical protein VG733_01950 [Chthoniobacteraceae bacterium]|nr:hypothetical protein [Chthoniobacteraceae bacterium]